MAIANWTTSVATRSRLTNRAASTWPQRVAAHEALVTSQSIADRLDLLTDRWDSLNDRERQALVKSVSEQAQTMVRRASRFDNTHDQTSAPIPEKVILAKELRRICSVEHLAHITSINCPLGAVVLADIRQLDTIVGAMIETVIGDGTTDAEIEVRAIEQHFAIQVRGSAQRTNVFDEVLFPSEPRNAVTTVDAELAQRMHAAQRLAMLNDANIVLTVGGNAPILTLEIPRISPLAS